MIDKSKLNNCLEILSKAYKDKLLTKPTEESAVVMEGTFMCLIEMTQAGPSYHQTTYEDLRPEFRLALRGKRVGESFGPIKVVAIFDHWLAAA